MTIQELIERYPREFAEYAERVLDSYFGNIFVTYRNQKILYVNEKMASSIHMTKEEVTGMTLEELRERKLWLRSVSQELYQKKQPFNAYNVSRWGEELFTHIEPIFDEQGEVVLSVQFSIPKRMLAAFSQYVDTERSSFQNYKDIAEYLDARQGAAKGLVFDSPAAKAAFSDALYLARMDSTVLICGETGTGKDVLANYIYHNSNRTNQPFVPVNCSAIPAELVESEFFGYERGAFTGARNSGKPGLFEMADGGTLFLDEVGELSLSMQAKLLRVLETGDVMRVGGTKMVHTDVRVIAATNRDLKRMVAEHKFREDLYYRLNVMPLFLPPLRERRADILPLARLFLDRNNRKYDLERSLTPEMQQGLLDYPWPGNIRELRNVIERYTISGRMDLAPPELGADAGGYGRQGTRGETVPLHQACEAFQRDYIRRTLEGCGGSVSKAAEQLGIHRTLLYKKMKKLGLEAAGKRTTERTESDSKSLGDVL